MITIPVQLSDELARRVIPLQDRLPEIIELGLRQIETEKQLRQERPSSRCWMLWLRRASPPCRGRPPGGKPRARRTPIVAGGRPASELIIAERRGEL